MTLMILMGACPCSDEKKPEPNKVNRICDSIRTELEKRDTIRYIDTILTTHVCKTPSDLESGLRVLLQLKGRSCYR